MAIGVAVFWHAKPGCEEEVEALLRTMQAWSLREPGCRCYFVHRTDDPLRFFLYEQYDGAEAVAAHHATEHYRRNVLERAPALVSSREITRCDVIPAER